MTECRTNGGGSCAVGGGCPTVFGLPVPFLLMLVAAALSLVFGARTRAVGDGRGGPELAVGLAALEQPYTAALRATERGDGPAAERAVAELVAAWRAFDAGAGKQLAEVPHGERARAEAARLIEGARVQVAGDPGAAHAALAEAGARLRELRVRGGPGAAGASP